MLLLLAPARRSPVEAPGQLNPAAEVGLEVWRPCQRVRTRCAEGVHVRYTAESRCLASGAAGQPELLYESERSRSFAYTWPDGAGQVICKQPLGAESGRRLRHELMILQRLAGVDGVPQLADGALGTDSIGLLDTGGKALAGTAADRTRGDDTSVRARAPAGGDPRGGASPRRGAQGRQPGQHRRRGATRSPTLIDFELATTFAEERPGFTHESQIAGTLAYLAPEQTGRTGRPVDQRADLYALGATLYELATGQPPFGDGDAAAA